MKAVEDAARQGHSPELKAAVEKMKTAVEEFFCKAKFEDTASNLNIAVLGSATKVTSS